MSKLFHIAVALILFGKWQQNEPLVKMGCFLGAVWAILLSIRGARVGLAFGWHLFIERLKNRARQKDAAIARNIDLAHDLERERARSETQLQAYKEQAEMMIKIKARGMDIERELFEMRRKLLELESNENKQMIQDILQTLN